jgi:hypothetical protein
VKAVAGFLATNPESNRNGIGLCKFVFFAICGLCCSPVTLAEQSQWNGGEGLTFPVPSHSSEAVP